MEPGSDPYGTDYEFSDRPTAATDSRTVAARTARPLIVGLTAFVTLLVLIAAAGNQWVSDRLTNDQGHTSRVLTQGLYESWLSYSWRFSPASSDHHNVLLGQVLLIAVTIVLGSLLVVAVTRGPVTFARAFFGTWMAVVAATQVGAFVRGLINGDTAGGQYPTRLDRALFGPAGPSQFTVWASLGLGLVTALVVASVAMLTRRSPARSAAPTTAALSVAEPPTFPDYVPPVGQPRTSVPPWQEYPAAEPLGSSTVEPISNETAPLPSVAPEAAQLTTPFQRQYEAASFAEQTTQLPRLADDAQTHEIRDDGPASAAVSDGDAPTTELAAARDADDATGPIGGIAGAGPLEQGGANEPRGTRFREPTRPEAAQPPAPESDTASAGGDRATTMQFPRPPDDEELGHLDPEPENGAPQVR